MTHTPPIPPGNTSPFPRQEPPHQAEAVQAAPAPDGKAPGWSLGRIVGAAAGVGAIALGVAAVLFPRETSSKTKKNKPKV